MTIYLAYDDGYNPCRDVMTTDDPDYAHVLREVLGWYDVTPSQYSVYRALRIAQLRGWGVLDAWKVLYG